MTTHPNTNSNIAKESETETLLLAFENGKQWFTHSFELILAESRLAATSLVAMIMFGLAAGMTLFVSILAMLGALAYYLINALALNPLVTAICVSILGVVITATLAYQVIKLSKNLLLKKSMKQVGANESSQESQNVQ